MSRLRKTRTSHLRWHEDLDRGEKLTVREVIRFYWENVPMAKTTRANANVAFGPLLHDLGHLCVAETNAKVIATYSNARLKAPTKAEDLRTGELRIRQVATPAVLRQELIKLKAAINHMILVGLIETKYQPLFPVPRAGAPKDVWLRREEASYILRRAKANRRERPQTGFKIYTFLAIAMFTGARKSAIEGLKWRDIDFEHNTIDFRLSGVENRIKRRVVIQMMPELRAALLEAKKVDHAQHDTYVLGDAGGQSAYKPVRRFLNRIKFGHVTPHTFRHSWTTWAVQDGVPFKTIADYLGVTVEVLERTYAHHDPHRLSPAFSRTLFASAEAEAPRPSAT